MITRIFAADLAVATVCKWGVILCLSALFFLLLLAVLVRMVPVLVIAGYDEVIELLFAWLTFLGALALWREGTLYRVVLAEQAAPSWMRRGIEFSIHVLMLAFALVLALKGYEFLRDAGEITPFLGVDKAYWYAALPVCGAIMAVYSVSGLWRVVRNQPSLGNAETITG
ncbi:TRAP transporter small permease [Microvirga massiliensis]|uniref:TRAP transporter small permease n=1 Tax=Microvirga massiliensis TaxID=1033741 RepID=UPI00062B3F6A|nr:TRAP transporter small permease subunit [Microvirga massiliensis]